MTQPTRDWIGYRVARWRDLAGLSQRQLAERIGVSREYISMIEAGKRPVSTRRLLADLAHALGVRIEDLTAQPVPPRNPDELILYSLAPSIRRALDGEDGPPERVRPVVEVAADVDRSLALRMAADWDALADLLPRLLVETAAIPGDDGRLLQVRTVANAGWTCFIGGYTDLDRRCAERAAAIADQLGEPVHRAMTAWAVAKAALAGGSARYALTVAEAGAEALQTSGSADPDAPGVAGMLHLAAALAAGADARPARAADHLTEAAQLAEVTVGDPWRMEFGAPNVGIWRVAVACELGEWGRAPELAAEVDVTRLRTPDRRANLHIDAARGWYETGNPGRATEALLTAMEISARATRVQPCVREVTAQMARDAGRRGGSSALQRLVAWVGVDPLSALPET
jgi:transcriptional regulator with XRE-family HTH domain